MVAEEGGLMGYWCDFSISACHRERNEMWYITGTRKIATLIVTFLWN